MKKYIIKNLKKLIAIILMLFTLSSYMQPIIAASGSGTWIGAQYNSGFATTSSSGILIRRLQNRDTGERLTVFCSEHGVPFDTRSLGKWYLLYSNKSNNKVCV